MTKLNPIWGDRCSKNHADILVNYPLDDVVFPGAPVPLWGKVGKLFK